MLRQNQEEYFQGIPDNKITHVVAFDPATQTTAQEIISEIKSFAPLAKVFYLGSSKLGIAGENDIDMTVLAEEHFNEYREIFKEHYGNPLHENPNHKLLKWEFERNGFPVELHLDDFLKPSLQEQIDTQELLENNPDLRSEYEQIKLQSNGLPWKEYLRKKYEFWNKILGIK